ncbi:MAG: NUDIX hydrolase [Alphaproteobacteria bacterium]|nr:NUDIX hydrolase [Alphaproteobacteria bacterium]MBU2378193.1 NUDIX hydrolase [Alphaproteobacteria bacterium]
MSDTRDDFDADRPVPAWDRDPPTRLAWDSRGETTTFENPWLTLTSHPATAPTGAEATYVVMRPRNLAAGMLPIHSDGTVTLVGQARFPLMNYSWEMPEGGAPFDEDALAGAKRELAEEAGLAARTWREVLRMELSNSITDERAIAWLAWDLSAVEQAPDPTEVIALARVPFMSLIAEIDRGAVRDAFTVATALRAYHMAREGLLPGWLAHAMLTRV